MFPFLDPNGVVVVVVVVVGLPAGGDGSSLGLFLGVFFRQLLGNLCGVVILGALGDLRDAAVLPAPGTMDYAVSNPPYFRAGSGASAPEPSRQSAREESNCTIADVCTAAARVLRWGGSFAVVYRPERLVDLLVSLRAHGMEPKRLRFVQTKDVPSLVLVESRRGGKPGLTVEPPLIIGSGEWEKVYFR